MSKVLEAVEKIRAEYAATDFEKKDLNSGSRADRAAALIVKPVCEALCGFCKASEAFAEAVFNSDAKFADCIKKIAKDMPYACESITVYNQAVDFYYPGAKITIQMNIDLTGTEKKEGKLIELDLMSLL